MPANQKSISNENQANSTCQQAYGTASNVPALANPSQQQFNNSCKGTTEKLSIAQPMALHLGD